MGPALYCAIRMAAKSRHSQVILCTDGQANKGLGSSEDSESDAFFKELTKLAKDKQFVVSIYYMYNQASKMIKIISYLFLIISVQVSMISVKGEDCNSSQLLNLVRESGGEVN